MASHFPFLRVRRFCHSAVWIHVHCNPHDRAPFGTGLALCQSFGNLSTVTIFPPLHASQSEVSNSCLGENTMWAPHLLLIYYSTFKYCVSSVCQRRDEWRDLCSESRLCWGMDICLGYWSSCACPCWSYGSGSLLIDSPGSLWSSQDCLYSLWNSSNYIGH